MNDTETFQHYQVLRREDGSLWELGRGAMGVTYKAFDINLRCFVALKVINAGYLEHPLARQRFIREARAAAALRHPHIATVYHLGMDAANFFYAMEFIDGETLDVLVRRIGPLPPVAALQIAIQVARALGAAARQRLVHRDIKPTNLMIVNDDEEGESHLSVKVIDFGLARSSVRDPSTQLTVGGFVGTPQYASPEQLEEKELDVRSDIYSLGVTLWFLMTGRPPFSGTLAHLITHHLTKEPPWAALSELPEPVRVLLRHMLEKDPASRPQSAGELRRDIEACLRATQLAEGGGGAAGEVAPHEDDGMGLLAGLVTPSGSSAQGGAPGAGELICSRFQLVRAVGEGNSGRVFEARDLYQEGRRVGVKMFHPEVVVAPAEYQHLAVETAKVQAAAHPHLLEIYSLERWRDSACLIMEWAGDLTLVDVLRHRGTLPVPQALALLKQAVSATDHARAHGLHRLELGLHQILVKLPDAEALPGAQGGSLAATLKIDALGGACGMSELTWAGGATLLPPRRVLTRDTRSSIDGLVENSQLHALGLLFYELIGGSPPPAGCTVADGAGEYFALPALGEQGNLVLRRALSLNPRFASDTAFFEAMALSTGFEPAHLRSVPPQSAPEPIRAAASGGGRGVTEAALNAALPAVEVQVPAPPPGEAVRGVPARRAVIRAQAGAERRRMLVMAAILVLAVGAGWWAAWRVYGPAATQAAAAKAGASAKDAHGARSPAPAQTSFLLNPASDWLDEPDFEPLADVSPEEDAAAALPADRDWPTGFDSLLVVGRPAPLADVDEGSGTLRGFAEAAYLDVDFDADPDGATAEEPAEKARTSAPRSHTHAAAHGRPVAAPTFWQRLFGTKPKPRSK